MKFDINAIFPSGTPMEMILWTLVLIAVLFNLYSWKRSVFLGLTNIAVIIVLAIFAMGAHPAHGETYPRPRPEVVYPVPEPRPRPTFTWDHAMERCTQVCPASPLRQECLYSCARRLTHPEWYGDK